MTKNIINIGLPSKGRLKHDTINIFKKNKLKIYSERGERDLFGYVKKLPNIKVIYLHARECIEQLSFGNIDIGFSGYDLFKESEINTQNKILINKITNLTNPDDIISSFDWETILNNREIFKCKYGILIDKENQLFESKAISNLDTKLMFMVEKEIFYSRNFELPKERCVVWTVNDSDEIMNILNMNVYGVVTDIGDKLD